MSEKFIQRPDFAGAGFVIVCPVCNGIAHLTRGLCIRCLLRTGLEQADGEISTVDELQAEFAAAGS